MKMRNKGKIHPFTSSSSTSPPPPNKDNLSVLKFLPASIFTMITVLSIQEREVLAYMITRSVQSTNPSFLPATNKQQKEKGSKKPSFDCHGHKSPALFDCDCFHCYTSFWFRWDSSPNRELIHQAIEAFEEHLSNGEDFKKSGGNGKSKRKEKMGRRKNEILSSGDGDGGFVDIPAAEESGKSIVTVFPAEEAAEKSGGGEVAVVQQSGHKGLARKVLPDVMGIFNSRLWSLWSPNV